MCYSGNCIWEDHMGDCRFPLHIKEIRDRFPHRLCGIDVQSQEEQEWLDEQNDEVKRIQENHKKCN